MYACAELFCVLTNVSNKFVTSLHKWKNQKATFSLVLIV